MRADAGGGRLLDRAIGFALTAVQGVTPDMLGRRTPCAAWDLTMLVLHLGESLAALHEGMGAGRVGREPGPEDPLDDPVSALRVRAVRVLRATAVLGRVSVGDRRLPGELLIGAGALEVAVHGWDIAQATGEGRAIPPVLAGDLLAMCPLVLPEPRRPLFADPVEPAPDGAPGERLVALLGRRPLVEEALR
ncbi:TIGR03086 family metal-binding protein [Actinomadura latina]|uniref:TIGR03086 family protein n=1 Tax=Actinomadura latina TaxID=163603 RepID=A0A846ZBR8_9ACTN|nr:TIGR03086 family metal-binding protein [Actinomadura latina]NKZ08174.1 TIGR03086 family protein [Actinomadura latina]